MSEIIDFVEQVAKIAHEANRVYCQTIGDDSIVSWEDAPEWQKTSARNGVVFHMNNPSANASSSHDNWLKEKTEEGWKHGPVKDPEKKEHPCCVPYNELPKSQQLKDYLFMGIVRAFLKAENAPCIKADSCCANGCKDSCCNG